MGILIIPSLLLWFVFPYYYYGIYKKVKKAGAGKPPRLTLGIYIVALLFGFVSLSQPLAKLPATSKRIEGKNDLRNIYKAQMAYFKKHNTFAGASKPEKVFEALNWKPKPGNIMFAFYCGKDALFDENSWSGYADSFFSKAYSKETKITDTKFECIAFGKLNSDSSFPDVWKINENGELTHLYDDYLGTDLRTNSGRDITEKPMYRDKYFFIIFLSIIVILGWRAFKEIGLLDETSKEA